MELKSLNMRTRAKSNAQVVPALQARAGFGALLRRVETEGRSLVIEKRGTPRAVLMSLRDYVRLAGPEPEVLRLIGEAAQRNGTSRMKMREIEQVVARARKAKKRSE